MIRMALCCWSACHKMTLCLCKWILTCVGVDSASDHGSVVQYVTCPLPLPTSGKDQVCSDRNVHCAGAFSAACLDNQRACMRMDVAVQWAQGTVYFSSKPLAVTGDISAGQDQRRPPADQSTQRISSVASKPARIPLAAQLNSWIITCTWKFLPPQQCWAGVSVGNYLALLIFHNN